MVAHTSSRIKNYKYSYVFKQTMYISIANANFNLDFKVNFNYK
jgi:hypothetical protein